jgi:NADPH-dependent 2,4-dienoyl-CoA reductase/sulfur reductase-like enzyme
MEEVDRRRFGAGVAALGALALVPAPAVARGRPKVVIVGGGPAGATVAGQLKRRRQALDVTLVEPRRRYTSCFFSNHYIGGLRSLASITHTYDGLGNLGVRLAHVAAADIDAARKQVRLEGGRRLPYDRLVVAPGIAFKRGDVEGYDEAAAGAMPHAWTGGEQSRLLREKLVGMPNGGVVVVAPPRNPYRCPPGPYERACVIAHYLKNAKPRSKLIILDPKMAFSKQPVFEEAFATYYKDIVELNLTNDIDDMALARVEAKSGLVVTKAGLSVKAALANIIPDQRAGEIALRAGLTDGDWCPVHLETFKSTKAADVYVVGDAAMAQDMPKSAFSANNQAKAVAADILAELAMGRGERKHYHNTCWSMLAPGDSVKIGADYTPGEANGKPALVPSGGFVSQPGEAASVRRQNYEDSLLWYSGLVAEVFAKG